MHDIYYGLISYEKGLSVQQEAIQKVRAQLSNGYLLGCEHEPVLTRGRRLHGQNVVPPMGFDPSIKIVDADRGGELALHTPGQLVIYPVFDLKYFGWSVSEYICVLHRVTQLWLKRLGIKAVTGEQSGLWTSSGKIVFIGIRVQHGITSHGLAINVQNDLSYYQNFVACGIQNASVDRVHSEETLESLFQIWTQTFRDNHETILCSRAVSADSESL
jgi:lipoate-protein ligase B